MKIRKFPTRAEAEYPLNIDTMYERTGQWHDWDLCYNGTFVYQRIPQSSYHIHGKISVNFHFDYGATSPGLTDWRGNLTLQTILPNGSKSILGVLYSFEGNLGTVYHTLVYSATKPISIDPGERLASIFLVESRAPTGANMRFRHFFNEAIDEFLVSIPLVP